MMASIDYSECNNKSSAAVDSVEVQTLSPDEKQLLIDYRSLSDEGRERIRQSMIAALDAEKQIQTISTIFEKIGWTEWNSSVHRSTQQLERLQRASAHKSKMTVCKYDPESGVAEVRGASGSSYLVSGHECECFDFSMKRLPCKHMYFLAMHLYKQYIK